MKQRTFNHKNTTPHGPQPQSQPHPQLSLLIAGAGIGGLVMGLMLEQAGIPFLILERSSTIRSTGGAISLCPNVMRVMAQLGLMEELLKESFPIRQIRYFDNMQRAVGVEQCDAVTDMLFCETRYGNAIRTLPRSVFISLLLSRIPAQKVLLGKRVFRIQETPSHMTCYCDDGSEYQGSILVGADGTYSAVRKNMYQTLSGSESDAIGGKGEVAREGADGIMMADGRVMPHQHCIVGIAESLDPEEFEALGGEYGEFQALRGVGHEHSIWLMPLTNYRIAWNVFFHFPEDLLQEYKDHQSCPPTPCIGSHENKSAAEGIQCSFPGQYPSHLVTPKQQPQTQQKSDGSWQSAAKRVHDRAQAALETLRDVPNPLSIRQGRFGDLLDKTEADKISKVTLEQGIFRRWFHGRTVLIGDAAHKSLPYAGQGANQAILDCVVLVSKLYFLVKPALSTAEVAFAAPIMPPVAHHAMSTRFRPAYLSQKPYKSKLRLKSKPTTIPLSLPPSPPLSPLTTIPTRWYTPTTIELTQVFQEYYITRSEIASQATWGGSWADTIFGGQGIRAGLARFAFFKLLPTRLFYAVSDSYFGNQPVLPFLPDVCSPSGGGEGGGMKCKSPSLSASVGVGAKSMFGGEWGAFLTLFR